ncbi:MAG: hypothetical protein R2762_06065 [Bryobacteraceae bacterium]
MTTTERGIPTMEDLRHLAGESGASISILMGPHRAGSGTRPAAVRLRALLHDADAALAGSGKGEADRGVLLGPLEALLTDPDFNAGHHQSFALFRNARTLAQYRLPWDAGDSMVVEGRFYVKPLVAPLGVAREFLLLALSRKRVRFFECDEQDCAPLPVAGGVPDQFEEFLALNLSDYKHMGRSPGGQTFGLGAERDKMDRHFRDYCVALGRGVTAAVRERKLPLVVAGTGDETTAWREANDENGMYGGTVEESPDGGLSERELAAKARAVVAEWKPPEAVHALELYERLAGTARTTRDLNAIVAAAAAGRVEHLFFAPGARVAGDYDRIVGHVRLSGEFVSRNDDLVNAAIADTLRNSGHAWGEVPEGGAAGAVLRY